MARYDRYGTLDDQIVEDLDIGFIGYNNKVRPDQLPQGVLAESLNGRMGIGGEWQVRKGIDLIAAPFVASSFTVPFYTYANFTVTTGNIARADTTLTFTASSHGLTNSTLVSLAGLGTAGVDPNGNHVATVTDSNTFTLTITGLTGKPTGTATIGAPKLDNEANVQIYGSTSFSDPSASSAFYIVCAGNSEAIAVKLSDGSTTSIAYPTGITITSAVDMIQAFKKVFIFRDGAVALEWDGDLTGSPAFSLVGNGDYTQPAKLDATGFVIASGVATVTVSNTLSIGDTVVLTTVGGSTLTIQSEHTVATRSSSAFTFFVDNADVSDQTDTEWTQKVSAGIGFIYMPAPSFGIIHQTRLVLPFDYTTSGSSGSATITNRGIRDEVIFSDILDTDTYDQIYGQFRLNAGTSDFIVGFLSFAEDKLVVFNRNSIHLISGTTDPATATSQLITSEVGCVARKTITQIGNNIMFLSDNGLYSVSFQDLYNLRGDDLPVSTNVEKTINRINKAHVSKAIGVYFENKYYLAVPLDDATINSSIIVYSFLNKQWESVDSVNDPNWESHNLIIAGNDQERGVYAVNQQGGVHQIDVRTDDVDTIITQIGSAQKSVTILGGATTRMFTAGSVDRKKWNNWDLHIQSSDFNESDSTLTAITENIDDTISIGTISEYNGELLSIGEDVSLRGRFGNRRAYGLQFKLDTTQGRPKFRAVKISGAQSFRHLEKAD
jgi:hypothetical protein